MHKKRQNVIIYTIGVCENLSDIWNNEKGVGNIWLWYHITENADQMFYKILLNPRVDKKQHHKADNYKSQYIIKQNKGRLCNTNSASDCIYHLKGIWGRRFLDGSAEAS